MRIFNLTPTLLLLSTLLSACGESSLEAESALSTPPLPTLPSNPLPSPELPSQPDQTQSVSFFIVAHPDDIELFMGREAYHKIAYSLKDKKVFIVLSGGDANFKNDLMGRAIPWWEAREHAHLKAVSYWNGYKDNPLSKDIQINNRYVQKTMLGPHIILYNFRLLDKDPEVSLADLVTGNSLPIWDLKYKKNYTLENIEDSIKEIISNESNNKLPISFYLTDSNPSRNPWDHKDHYATSSIVENIYPMIKAPCKNLSKYLSYSIKDLPVNLVDEDRDRSFKTWSIMGDTLASYGYRRNDDDAHMILVGKEYKSLTIGKEDCLN